MKLSERLDEACAGVLIAEATGNLNIMTRAVNKLLSEAREAAALARRVEGAAKVKVRGKVGEVCTVAISHDYCGQRVALVPVEGGA